MERCALRGKDNDPFILSTKRSLECKLLEEVGLAWEDPKARRPQFRPDRLGCTKRLSRLKQAMRRLLMALLGGLAIIAPFLIMLLVGGQLVRLVCACAFMLAFAVGLAVGSELEPDRIGLATAAYAAALVVFVGTNPPLYWNS